MRRLIAAVAVALLTTLTLTACGGSSSSGDAGSTLPVKKIAITFNGDDVTPNGSDIDVKVGQRLEFDVTADKPGEIHVHSTPEQELPYKAGKSTLTITTLDQPGTVDVEVHDLDKVIVQLEVH